jgi:hypothetical protein
MRVGLTKSVDAVFDTCVVGGKVCSGQSLAPHTAIKRPCYAVKSE